MPRRSRTTASAASANLRTPTPHEDDFEDEEMIDAAAAPSVPSSPAEDIASTRESEQPSEPATPAAQPVPVIRRRRPGRPPKNRPPDWNLVEDTGEDSATPFKRRRGRPPTGAARIGKSKYGPLLTVLPPIDDDGNLLEVVGDEPILPDDPEGEEKIDKSGHLKGGREFRCRTLPLHGRGERMYMLSTEPARCIGFRDSYLFFQKHRKLFKIILGDEEKRDLIERELIPHSYKGRAIAVVTARSVFREFGARIIVDGKKITDDYQVQAARDNGDIEGEPAEPLEKGLSGNQEQTPLPFEGSKKRKLLITDTNWMHEHALEASRFNASLVLSRQETQDGVYDPHTNAMLYPKIMQPTHARWERISATQGKDDLSNDVSKPTINGAEGIHRQLYAAEISGETKFKHVDPVLPRNFLIADTYASTPSVSSLTVPGEANDDYGLSAAFNLGAISPEVLSELPDDCLKALDEARRHEQSWSAEWGTEATQSSRAKLRIGV